MNIKAIRIVFTILLFALCPISLIAQNYKVNRVKGDVTVKEGRNFIKVKTKQSINSNQQLRLADNSYIELISKSNNKGIYKEGPLQGTITELTKDNGGIIDLVEEYVVFLYKRLFSNTPVKIQDVGGVIRDTKGNANILTCDADVIPKGYYVYKVVNAKLINGEGEPTEMFRTQELHENDTIELNGVAGIQLLEFNDSLTVMVAKPGKYRVGTLFCDDSFEKKKLGEWDFTLFFDKLINE